MLAQRLIAVIIIIPLAILVNSAGGWLFSCVISAILGIAAWEYWRMFHRGGFNPSATCLIGGSFLISLSRVIPLPYIESATLAFVIAFTATIHLLAFERGNKNAAVDFAISLAGTIYIGWFGSHVIPLRNLPGGEWWTILAIPSIGIADGGAYLIGKLLGKHKMSPLLSPNKTWEGYFGSLLSAAIFTPLLAFFWQLREPLITPAIGLIMGIIIAILAPLGDLTISMIKRQFGVKDTSHLIPGHGGVLDRIDSWLWAAPIAFYLISWFFI